MNGLTSNLKNVCMRASVLALPLLFLPLKVDSGVVEPRVVCGAETDAGECTFATLRMCEHNGEMLQDAMPVLD